MQFVCVDDFFFFSGRGLLEPPSKSMGSKVSLPKDCPECQGCN